MAIETRLTERLALRCPIISAPTARAGGDRLAAAVSDAGGRGLIGGGYADPEWVATELDQAGDARVGVGFGPARGVIERIVQDAEHLLHATAAR